MKTTIATILISLSGWAANADFVFDDFSSLTYSPTTAGVLVDSGFTLTLAGDDGSFFSDFNNGSTNALFLGNNVPATRITALTLAFSVPITSLRLNLDAMHLIQQDSITTSTGLWTSFPATLSLSGSTLSSTAPVINPGGSGIDDDLNVILTFGAPVSAVTFTSVGAFFLDTITVSVPEPTTAALLILGVFSAFVVGRRSMRAVNRA